MIFSYFQLPNYQRFRSNETAMQYIFSDQDTSTDAYSRFVANPLLHVTEILKYKYTHLDMPFLRMFKQFHMFPNSYRVKFILYDRWTTNNSYGGIVKAFAEDEVDFLYGFVLLAVDRINHFTPIMQFAEMR